MYTFYLHINGHFEGGTGGNAVSIVQVFKDAHELVLSLHALWLALQPKMHRIAGFFTYNLNIFSGGNTPRLPRREGRPLPATTPSRARARKPRRYQTVSKPSSKRRTDVRLLDGV